MTDETPQTENDAAGGQSRAGEAGANLTAVLGANFGEAHETESNERLPEAGFDARTHEP